ncbi:MAG: hypothetical protein GY794_10165 [bacterium]|nr:hypothetical protein [bacterium]
MRKTIQMMTLVLLAGMMIAGCDSMSWSSPDLSGPWNGTDNAVKPPPQPTELADLLNEQPRVNDNTNAVDIGAGALKDYQRALNDLAQLQRDNTALAKKYDESQKALATSQSKLTSAERELSDANEMLTGMKVDLAKWKQNVLGFRGEMLDSQRVLIESVTKLHVLISGGVAAEETEKQPQPIATKTGS